MLIDEREISDRIHAAFEMDPLAGGFDRLKIVLDSHTPRTHGPARVLAPHRWRALLAGFAVAAVAASALGYALVKSQVAVSNPPRPAATLLPVAGYWAYSADDIALQVASPSGPYQPDRGYVVISHDGGKTWMRTPLDFPLINMRWIDSQHLVAVMNNVGPPTEVASTSDGGATWRTTLMPTSTTWTATSSCCLQYQPGAMFFLNSHEGWQLCGAQFASCGSNGGQTILYHTLDAGAHWQAISTVSSSDAVVPLGVTFTDSEHGFMPTMDSDSKARLLRTADGGKTWSAVELPGSTVAAAGEADCGSNRCAVDPTFFGSSGLVTVVGPGIAPYTVTSTDGGLTWLSPHTIPFEEPIAPPTPWVQALDPSDWWTVAASGALYRTQDEGGTWQHVATSLPAGYTLDSITPGQNGVLWGVTRDTGAGQFPLRSSDGGANWSLVKLPS